MMARDGSQRWQHILPRAVNLHRVKWKSLTTVRSFLYADICKADLTLMGDVLMPTTARMPSHHNTLPTATDRAQLSQPLHSEEHRGEHGRLRCLQADWF